ncbi:hypothetical protein HK104_005147 [Borealophlyctis nickersoniae]|nr:hypothetical protein HK104_005147 [Borealophlyctis nickersoniae]
MESSAFNLGASSDFASNRNLSCDEYRRIREECKALYAKIKEFGKTAEDVRKYKELRALLKRADPSNTPTSPLQPTPTTPNFSTTTPETPTPKAPTADTPRTSKPPSRSSSTSSLPANPTPCTAALHRLRQLGKRAKRPKLVQDMTVEQAAEEKREVKREFSKLKEMYGSSGGMTASAEEKALMKDLYQRYLDLKSKLESEESPTTPTPETPHPPPTTPPAPQPSTATTDPISSDLTTYKRLRNEKKLLQIRLNEFQEQFKRTHGRPVTTADDRAPVAVEYQRYKELKSMLAEMEMRMGIEGGGALASTVDLRSGR